MSVSPHVLVLLLTFLAVQVPGASQNRSDPAFEVASVKPNATRDPVMAIRLPPGGVTAVNVTPQLLLRYAFALPDARIVDLPEWARRSRFDIVAKAPVTAVDADMRPMVRTLLRDRFHLVTRHELRPLQVHVLTTEPGRPLGPRLTAASAACGQGGPAEKSGALSSDERCGLSIAFGRVRGGEVPLSELAKGLATLTGGVIDRTGLSGRHDFTLDYTPDAVALEPAIAKDFPDVDPGGPSLATALGEQLGLRWRTETEPGRKVVASSTVRRGSHAASVQDTPSGEGHVDTRDTAGRSCCG